MTSLFEEFELVAIMMGIKMSESMTVTCNVILNPLRPFLDEVRVRVEGSDNLQNSIQPDC